MKKIISYMCGAVVAISISCSVFAIEAVPSTSSVLVDGKEVVFNAFNIEDNNYFKLRDIAYVLNGTSKQFDVGYDANTDSVFLTSNKAYTEVGGEMELGGNSMSEATPTNQKVIQDGKETDITAYNIDGSNYFKLRDLGEKFGFGVDYNEENNSVIVETKKDEKKSENLDENGYATDLFTPSILPTPIPHKPIEIPAPKN